MNSDALPRQLSSMTRGGIAAGALASLTLLAVTIWLKPMPSGLGTHQQLGLPPCSARLLFDLRCPACGMTTSWAHFVRGQWMRSCSASVGGFSLAVMNVVISPWLLASAIAGRWVYKCPRGEWVGGTTIAILIVMLLDWGYRLMSGS